MLSQCGVSAVYTYDCGEGIFHVDYSRHAIVGLGDIEGCLGV